MPPQGKPPSVQGFDDALMPDPADPATLASGSRSAGCGGVTDTSCMNGSDALVLRFAGEGLWGYSGVLTRGRDLATEADVVAALLRAALAFSRPAELELGPLHPSMFDLHAAAAARLGWRAQVFRIHGGAPFIDCPRTDRSAWERSRKKAARSDILRCEKRLAEAGSLAIFQLDNAALNAASAQVAMAGFLGMYHRQWAQNRFRREPRWLDFYQRLAVAGAQAGTLEFSFVTLDGQPVAAHYGFVHKARRYYFTPTYDVDLARFSPGKVLLRRLVEGSFDRGEVFDFQNDLEPYKLDWSTGVADRFVIKLWP